MNQKYKLIKILNNIHKYKSLILILMKSKINTKNKIKNSK